VIESQYPVGLDFAWVGRDELGHVAAFITGGCGPIPETALWQVALSTSPEETLLGFPVCGAARLLVSYSNMQSFEDLATRGVFVYDWSDVHRVAVAETNRYQLVAAPANPLSVEQGSTFLGQSVGVVASSFHEQPALAVPGVQP